VLTVMFPNLYNICFLVVLRRSFLWRAVHVVFGLSQPSSVDDLFNRWCKVGGIKHNFLLLTAASAIWISRNEVVFDKCKPKSYLQVLFRGTYWLSQWALLQHHEHQHAKTPLPTAFTQFHHCSIKSMGTQIRSIAQTRLRFTVVPWHNELQVVITRKKVRENCLTTSSWQRHYRPGDLFSISPFN